MPLSSGTLPAEIVRTSADVPALGAVITEAGTGLRKVGDGVTTLARLGYTSVASPQVKVVTADETVTNSITKVASAYLNPAIGPNEVQTYEVSLYFTDGASVPGNRFSFDVPPGATYEFFAVGSGSNLFQTEAGPDCEDHGYPYSTCHGVLHVTNGGVPGNVTLMWAQDVLNNSSVLLKKGSRMVGHQVS